MELQIVSFETAKLAKEKGFNWKVSQFYEDNELTDNFGKVYDFNDPEEQALWSLEITSAPTQALLQQWLRKEYKIYVTIIPDKYNDILSFNCIIDRDVFDYPYSPLYREIARNKDEIINTNNYEDGLEEGLKLALKLIMND